MINPKVKAGCGVITVFGLGFVAGVIVLLIFIVKVIPLSEGWKSDESKAFVTRQISKQLKLTEEQQEQVRPIVDEALESRWALRREYLLEDRRLLEEEFFPRIGELLDDEQRERGRKMLQRWRKEQRFKLEAHDAKSEARQKLAPLDGDGEAPVETPAEPENQSAPGEESGSSSARARSTIPSTGQSRPIPS